MKEKNMSALQKPLRSIRSFVQRRGRISTRQGQALETLWPKYCIDLIDEPINWQELFNRDATRVIEIGFGMGHSLLEMARLNPDQDFIGIEVYLAGIGSLLADLDQHALKNVKIIY